MSNNAALVRETQVFVKKQSAENTFAMPAGTDAIRVTEVPGPKQSMQYTQTGEIVDSRSRQARIQNGYAEGQFSLPVISRPAGSAGASPAEGVLMEGVLGSMTSTANTVTFSPAKTLPFISCVVKEGHTYYYATDCLVNSMTLRIAREGSVALTFDLMARKVTQAGTSETTTGSTTGVVNLASGGAKRFQDQSYIQVGDDDNGGAGYLISSVSVSADTLTLSTSMTTAPGSGVTVNGYAPTPSFSGEAAKGSKGTLTLDGESFAFVSAEITVNNNVAPDLAEISPDDDFPSELDEGEREVTGNIVMRLREANLDWARRARGQVQGALIVTAGDGTGGRLRVNLPQMECDTPDHSSDGVKRNMTVPVHGYPTTANEDETSLEYF